jgi:hypothetical protein
MNRSKLLESAAFPPGTPEHERVGELAHLVSSCAWMAETLRRSLSTAEVIDDEEWDPAVESTSGIIAQLLGIAADELFNLEFEKFSPPAPDAS